MVIYMYVYECLDCGFTIGDPNGKLDPKRYSVSCLKCHHAHWKYRKATGFEELKMKLHLMKVYKG